MKVSILGTGHVGSAIANNLIYSDLFCEICLINRSRNKLWAEEQELLLCKKIVKSECKIYQGTLQDSFDSDILIVTASDPYKLGANRNDYIESTKKLMRSLANDLSHADYNGIIIVVSNPVDLATNILIKYFDKNTNKIWGTGTSIDTQRLQIKLRELKLDKLLDDIVCVGMHGENCFVPNILIRSIAERYRGVWTLKELSNKINFILKDINNEANKIMEIKGATTWGIASIVTNMVKSIVLDYNIIMPITHKFFHPSLNSSICLSFPARISNKGIAETKYISLTKQECEWLAFKQNELNTIIMD